jgi:hypothetical protein
MSKKAEWNDKWRNLRLELVTNLPSHVVDFFDNSTIVEGWVTSEPIYDDEDEYTDEDEIFYNLTFENKKGTFVIHYGDYMTTIEGKSFKEFFELNSEDAKTINRIFEQELPYDDIVRDFERENSKQISYYRRW